MFSNIKNEFSLLPKSKIKAGEGIDIGLYPFFTSSDIKILGRNEYEHDEEAVILGTGGKASCNYINGKFSFSTDNYALKSKGRILTKFLYYFLRHNNMQILDNGFHGAGLKHISKDYILNISVPLFTIEKQKEAVKLLDSVNTTINHEIDLLHNYDELIKSRFISQEVFVC